MSEFRAHIGNSRDRVEKTAERSKKKPPANYVEELDDEWERGVQENNVNGSECDESSQYEELYGYVDRETRKTVPPDCILNVEMNEYPSSMARLNIPAPRNDQEFLLIPDRTEETDDLDSPPFKRFKDSPVNRSEWFEIQKAKIKEMGKSGKLLNFEDGIDAKHNFNPFLNQREKPDSCITKDSNKKYVVVSKRDVTQEMVQKSRIEGAQIKAAGFEKAKNPIDVNASAVEKSMKRERMNKKRTEVPKTDSKTIEMELAEEAALKKFLKKNCQSESQSSDASIATGQCIPGPSNVMKKEDKKATLTKEERRAELDTMKDWLSSRDVSSKQPNTLMEQFFNIEAQESSKSSKNNHAHRTATNASTALSTENNENKLGEVIGEKGYPIFDPEKEIKKEDGEVIVDKYLIYVDLEAVKKEVVEHEEVQETVQAKVPKKEVPKKETPEKAKIIRPDIEWRDSEMIDGVEQYPQGFIDGIPLKRYIRRQWRKYKKAKNRDEELEIDIGLSILEMKVERKYDEWEEDQRRKQALKFEYVEYTGPRDIIETNGPEHRWKEFMSVYWYFCDYLYIEGFKDKNFTYAKCKAAWLERMRAEKRIAQKADLNARTEHSEWRIPLVHSRGKQMFDYNESVADKKQADFLERINALRDVFFPNEKAQFSKEETAFDEIPTISEWEEEEMEDERASIISAWDEWEKNEFISKNVVLNSEPQNEEAAITLRDSVEKDVTMENAQGDDLLEKVAEHQGHIEEPNDVVEEDMEEYAAGGNEEEDPETIEDETEFESQPHQTPFETETAKEDAMNDDLAENAIEAEAVKEDEVPQKSPQKLEGTLKSDNVTPPNALQESEPVYDEDELLNSPTGEVFNGAEAVSRVESFDEADLLDNDILAEQSISIVSEKTEKEDVSKKVNEDDLLREVSVEREKTEEEVEKEQKKEEKSKDVGQRPENKKDYETLVGENVEEEGAHEADEEQGIENETSQNVNLSLVSEHHPEDNEQTTKNDLFGSLSPVASDAESSNQKSSGNHTFEPEKSLSPGTLDLLVAPEDVCADYAEPDGAQYSEEYLLGEYGPLEEDYQYPVLVEVPVEPKPGPKRVRKSRKRKPQPEEPTAAECEPTREESNSTEPHPVSPIAVQPETKKFKTVEQPIVEPKVVKPLLLEPEAMGAEVAELEVANLKTADPEVVDPEIMEPEAAKPKITEPELADPEVVGPEVKEPEIGEMEVAEPKATEQELVIPVDTKPKKGRGRPKKPVKVKSTVDSSAASEEVQEAAVESVGVDVEAEAEGTSTEPPKKKRKNEDMPFIPARTTRSKRVFLSKNNPAPRVRKGETAGPSTTKPVKITGVESQDDDLDEEPSEKFKKLPIALQRLVEPNIADPKKKKQNGETEAGEAEVKTEILDDENWVIPDPILPNSRKSKKRQREEKHQQVLDELKQEVGNTAVLDDEIQVIMENFKAVKEEEIDVEYQVTVSKLKADSGPVELEPEPTVPKIMNPDLVENPTHGYIMSKSLWDQANEFFMSDPLKFSNFIILLARDTEQKGRVFKFSATVDDRLSEFSPALIQHLASRPRVLTDEFNSCIDYNTFSNTFRDKSSLLLSNHKITPFFLHKIVDKITEVKNTLRDDMDFSMKANALDAIDATEKILQGHYIDNVMKMAGLSQITWTTQAHVHRRLEMIYHGWKMFMQTGGFFRVLLALDRPDVRPLTEEFRDYCTKYLADIDENYAKAKKIYSMSDNEILKHYQDRSNMTSEEIEVLDKDVKGISCESHNERCSECLVRNVSVYFSTRDLRLQHEKLHDLDAPDCQKCFDPFDEMAMIFHRINYHNSMRVDD